MRSDYCGQVDESRIGEEISVCGWVHRRRDHGGVIFVDLRDREGLLQVVFDPDRPEIFAEAERIRSEYVLAVKGIVRERPEGTINPNMPTGKIEVLAHDLVTLNELDIVFHEIQSCFQVSKHSQQFFLQLLERTTQAAR